MGGDVNDTDGHFARVLVGFAEMLAVCNLAHAFYHFLLVLFVLIIQFRQFSSYPSPFPSFSPAIIVYL